LRRLCSTVLVMEAIVIALAIPVAIHIDHLSPPAAGLVGGVGAGLAVILAMFARWQLRVTLVLGSMLQIYLIASGQIIPVMYFLGSIFAACWVTGIWLGRRVERATGHQ
jgi:hypothetical protein